MRTFFTSDLHLGHANIIKYCKRPFNDEDDMNATLIRNWNERVSIEDIVYHIGDFCFRGGIEGGFTKAQQWEKLLNGTIVHIKGNHDLNNGTKAIIDRAILEFGKKLVLAQHWPPLNNSHTPDFLRDIPKYVDFVICGHVHQNWKNIEVVKNYGNNDTSVLKIVSKKFHIINIGTDAWNFRPVALDEVIGYYNKINNEGKVNE